MNQNKFTVYDTDAAGDNVELGVMHILKRSPMFYKGQYGDHAESHLRVKMPKGISDDKAKRLINAWFRYNCRCSHDCCGHWQTWVDDAIRVSKREWVVYRFHAMNC